MEQVMLKLCGENANGIMQKAKRAVVADSSAGVDKKKLRNRVMLTGGTTFFETLNTVGNAYAGNPVAASCWGVCAALIGTAFGIDLICYKQAATAKKQTLQALKDIIDKKEFKDIFNRYLRINGMEDMTSEEILAAYKAGKMNMLPNAVNKRKNESSGFVDLLKDAFKTAFSFKKMPDCFASNRYKNI